MNLIEDIKAINNRAKGKLRDLTGKIKNTNKYEIKICRFQLQLLPIANYNMNQTQVNTVPITK